MVKKLGQAWGLSYQDVALTIAPDEIQNRIMNFPSVRESLLESPFDIKQFTDNVRACWVMRGRFDSVCFSTFIRNEEIAKKLGKKVSLHAMNLMNIFNKEDIKNKIFKILKVLLSFSKQIKCKTKNKQWKSKYL